MDSLYTLSSTKTHNKAFHPFERDENKIRQPVACDMRRTLPSWQEKHGTLASGMA
jgi:hypothetical protein